MSNLNYFVVQLDQNHPCHTCVYMLVRVGPGPLHTWKGQGHVEYLCCAQRNYSRNLIRLQRNLAWTMNLLVSRSKMTNIWTKEIAFTKQQIGLQKH